MGDSKYRSSARRKQSCRRAKRRARAPHSRAPDCSLLPACSWLTVTFFFTSARFDEAIIEVKTDPIYPKFAVKLGFKVLSRTLTQMSDINKTFQNGFRQTESSGAEGVILGCQMFD